MIIKFEETGIIWNRYEVKNLHSSHFQVVFTGFHIQQQMEVEKTDLYIDRWIDRQTDTDKQRFCTVL